MHIAEHAGVLASPETRNDPVIVQAVLEHITMHENEVAASMPPPVGPDGLPLPPGGSAGAPGEIPTADAAPMPSGAPGGPGMPNMPTNPASGEQAPIPGQV
jgi:hypothetical protein